MRLTSFIIVGLMLAVGCSHGWAAEGKGEGESDAPPTRLAIALPLEGELMIDGALEESAWQALVDSSDDSLVLDQWTQAGEDNQPSYDDRKAYLLYDEQYLYVGVVVAFGMDDTLIDGAGANDEPDSVQVDFARMSLGIDWEGEQIQEIMIPYLIPIQSAAVMTDEGWTAEIAIPWDHIEGQPRPGEKRRFNIGGRDLSGPISWGAVRDLRDIERFGHLQLKGEAEAVSEAEHDAE